MGDSHRICVHQALGNGAVADTLLWKTWRGGTFLLVSSTALWILFEQAGYNLLTFVSNVLLLLIVVLFFWGKSASLLNRPLPPIPELYITEECVVKASEAMRVWINRVLSVAHDITIGRKVKVVFKVGVSLWLISYIGSLFNFLTLIYIGILLSLSVPFLYDKYQHHIDDKLGVAHKTVLTQYKKVDENILRKLSLPTNKEKKIQ